MVSLIDRYKGFIIDLDGVVYLLDDPIPGSPEVVRYLLESGAPFVFLTNNSVSTPLMYVEKLARLGMEVEPRHVVTSAQAVRRYLEQGGACAGRTAFVVGEKGLVREIEATGLEIVNEEEAAGADFVFVGWDREFDFGKLKAAVAAVRNGAEYIATNADATYPTPGGLLPGAGSIVAAITTGAGREPIVMGKPNPYIVELALERMGVGARSALLVGDRLDTDIAAGLAAGVDTLLVLTGVSRAEEVEETGIRPTHIRDDLGALMDP